MQRSQSKCRFYTRANLKARQLYTVDSWVKNHIKARRLKAGQEIVLFNGAGKVAIAKVVSYEQVEIISCNTSTQTKHLEIAVCLFRGAEFEYMLQKVTELGVTKIKLLVSDFCQFNLNANKLSKKFQRWQHILTSACEQSGRSFIPELSKPRPIDEFITTCNHKIKLILDPQASINLTSFYSNNNQIGESCIAIIGPEGGFSNAELELATTNKFVAVAINNNILKASTAPISYCSIVEALRY